MLEIFRQAIGLRAQAQLADVQMGALRFAFTTSGPKLPDEIQDFLNESGLGFDLRRAEKHDLFTASGAKVNANLFNWELTLEN
ncbi:MAG: hypothetical protein KY445_02775 [Armatimonadetes bacterium]|nr:hypothetical protein [Armatimonadota bacterium]